MHALSQQRAAELRLLVKQHYAPAGAGGGQRGGETGRTAANHRQVAMRVMEGVVVGIGRLRRVADARRLAHHRFVEPRPGPGGRMKVL